MKKLNSPPMARRSKPFSAADRLRKKVVQPQQQQPSPVKKPAGKNSGKLDLKSWSKMLGCLIILASIQQYCSEIKDICDAS